MESTVRIDYNSHIPVIKIITPKQLHEDSDPKDRLIEEFLYTPCVHDRNRLFYLYQHFDLETPFRLSTIAAIGYFEELEKLREHIERRVMTLDSKCECHEFYDTKASIEEKSSLPRIAPSDYGTYLKIREFFDWVGEQKYVEKAR